MKRSLVWPLLAIGMLSCDAVSEREPDSGGSRPTDDGGRTPALDAGADADAAAPNAEPLRVLVEGEDEPYALAIDDRRVYWTSRNQLRTASIAGGESRTLATGRGLRRIAVAEGFVYFTDGNAGTVSRVDRDGGDTQVIGTGVQPNGIAIRERTVYWTNGGMTLGDGAVMRGVLEGGSPMALADALSQPAAVGVDDAFVYFTSTGQSCGASSGGAGGCVGGGVSKVPRAGGAVVVITAEGTPAELAVGARGVYWAASGLPRVMFAPADGTAPRMLANVLGETPGSLAVDDDALYFASTDRGRVLKVDLDGGTPVPLVTDLGSVGGIAVDRDWVYVAATSQGRIVRIAKDGSAAQPGAPITGPCPTPIGSAAAIAASPRADQNLELLALRLDAGEVVATQATYDRVIADVTAIRALAPALADVGYFPPHDGKTLLVQPSEQVFKLIEAGQYSAWDCLNEFYGLTSIEPQRFSIGSSFVLVKLKGLYDLALLAGVYAQLPGITSVEPDGFGGDNAKICAARAGDQFEYMVDRAGGDCPAGCTTHDAQHFRSSAPGVVEALETWNSESGAPAPQWFTRMCRR